MTAVTSDQPQQVGWNLYTWLAFIGLFVGYLAFEQDYRTSTYPDFVPEAEIRESWAEGGSRMRQLGALLMAGIGALGIILPSERRLRWLDPLSLVLAAYLLLVAGSLSWSIDPDATRRRLIVLGLFAFTCIGLARQLKPRVIPEITMLVLLGYLLLGIAAEVALGTFRPFSGEHRLAGLTHPNNLASYLVIMCIAAWCVHRQSGPLRPVALLILVFGIGCLYLTRSRTAAAGFVFAFAFATSLTADRLRAVRWMLLLGWLVSFLTITVLLSGADLAESGKDLLRMGRREAALEDTGSLTGRLPLWEELWGYVEQRPLWGHGYDAFWTADNFIAIADEIDWGPASAHSSYLEVILDLGYVGFVVMMLGITLIVAKLLWGAATAGDSLTSFALALFLYTLLHGLTEAGIRTPSTTTFFVALPLVSLLLFREAGRCRSATLQ